MGTIFGIIAAALLFACLLLPANRCYSQTPAAPAPASGPPPAATTTEGVKSLDREQIREMLKKLSDSPPPKKLSAGAMCYSMAAPPQVGTFICPKCGERTLYDESEKAPPLDRAEKGTARLVEWEVPACRRQIAAIRKLVGDSVTLDESQFCRKCSPNTTSPKLVLHVAYKGEKKTVDIDNVDCDDLCILHDLFSGKLTAEGDQGREYPLKDRLPRLQELLGVKLEK